MVETVSPGTQLQVALLDRNASAVRAWAAVHKDKPLPEEFGSGQKLLAGRSA